MSELSLQARLNALGIVGAADGLDDLVALATKKRWGPTQLLEHLVDIEERERSRRGLERRLSRSHLGRFKTIADYDWNWPTKIDRALVESAVGLHFPANPGSWTSVLAESRASARCRQRRGC